MSSEYHVNKKERNIVAKDDSYLDATLRPDSWGEYIGQKKITENIRMMIDAAKKRKEPIDHLLFYGPAGLGKTTLANIIAKNMGGRLRQTAGPALTKAGDIAAILSALEDGDVLFIDEAHRINRAIEEMLYPAMESGALHIVVGKGAGARMLSLTLPRFTLIAATTRPNLLSAPLRSRFGGVFHLDYYMVDDMKNILKRSAKLLDLSLTHDAIDLLARASRCTPRIANRLLKRVRDFCQVQGHATADLSVAQQALDMFSIDNAGLEEHDRKLLKIIIERFFGGPVGINALAAALGDDKGIIEDVYEPYLVKTGFITRSPLGRVATPQAYQHLSLKPVMQDNKRAKTIF